MIAHATFLTRRRPAAAGLCLLLASAGCGATVERETAVDRGRRTVTTPTAFSGSTFNAFSCATCHGAPKGAEGSATATLFPGAPLGGASARPTFWGGRFVELRDAVTECVTKFQRAADFDVASEGARDLYAYLRSVEGDGPQGPVPFTVPPTVVDIPRGDPTRGQGVWDGACRSCHGDAFTGNGRLGAQVAVVPNETAAFHGKDGPDVTRLVIIEKVRHGGYLAFTGTMPPFSVEALPDGQLGDLLAFLRL